MEFFLTFLKFAGILVSGALGIIGTVTETHVEVQLPSKTPGGPTRTVRRLSRWGRHALALTIAAAAVALGAQLAEEVISYRKSQTSQRHTEKQLALATESLHSIQRVVTRFDEVDAKAWLELLPTTPPLQRLAQELDKLSHADSSEIAKDGWPEGLALGSFEKGRKRVVLSLRDVYQPALHRWLPSLTNLNESLLLAALGNMELVIGFNRKPQPIRFPHPAYEYYRGQPDLLLAVDKVARPATLHYGPQSRRMFVELAELNYPRDQWDSNGSIIGLQDLNEAQVFFAVRDPNSLDDPPPAPPILRPVLISLQMQNYKFSFEDFKGSRYRNITPRLAGDRIRTNWNWLVFETTFPALEKAFRGELFKPFPQME